MHLKVISTTIFDRIEWNIKPPSQIKIKDEAAQKPKRAIFSILGGWGRGVAAAYTQSYVTSYISETASQQ